MSADDELASFPRSMRHKQILDVAEENPDATVDELASNVPSATPELVERVLDKYGDPADKSDASSSAEACLSSDNGKVSHSVNPERETVTSDNSADSEATTEQEEIDEEGHPQLDNLPQKHRELVEAVAAHPNATQQELAEHFDVSRATISRRATDIEGFEWKERESFAEAVVDDPPSIDLMMNGQSSGKSSAAGERTESTEPLSKNGESLPERLADIPTEIERLNERVTTLEESREGAEAKGESIFEDPELVHKIAHACIHSERITESEELRILKEVLA